MLPALPHNPLSHDHELCRFFGSFSILDGQFNFTVDFAFGLVVIVIDNGNFCEYEVRDHKGLRDGPVSLRTDVRRVAVNSVSSDLVRALCLMPNSKPDAS